MHRFTIVPSSNSKLKYKNVRTYILNIINFMNNNTYKQFQCNLIPNVILMIIIISKIIHTTKLFIEMCRDIWQRLWGVYINVWCGELVQDHHGSDHTYCMCVSSISTARYVITVKLIQFVSCKKLLIVKYCE